MPESGSDWTAYQPELLGLCRVKAEELRLLGYAEVTAEDVWRAVLAQVKGEVALYDLVARIFGLSAGQFMNYVTRNAYRAAASKGEDEPSMLV
ncbi:hypothetical protein GCM10010885_14100 [Alicyclobacillus cellulosilyticus]|uniref:Post-transcriptional regulator n=1 Tax=Alicyclobacillus cellulosilyticus TaxID=1003997 RepID=A0A917KA71_9BACL|nr:post-transcriptional regulator [Alicyclobacillus cellulosilyticus]GGJ06111.1 hypothetical protein GCM10010885_14100 [Alicyclobacillus cellulosilyticus]